VSCPEASLSLGAYVLGGLAPDERRQVEEHLERCPACAAELTEFRSLPSLLAQVDPDDLGEPRVVPSPDLFARVSAAAAAEDDVPPVRRTRRWLVVAAALVAVLGAAAGVGTWAAGVGTRVAGAGGGTHTAAAGTVSIIVTTDGQDSGTALDVNVAGLPPHQTCRLVVVDQAGHQHEAGTWTATSAGEAWFRGWTDVDRPALSDVLLLGADGEELIRVAV
jgi:hypothetical protein